MPDKPYLLSSFSVNLLAHFPAYVQFDPLTVEEARAVLSEGFESVVGHADTAALFTTLLGVEVPVCRATVSLPPGVWAVLGQYRGPRLQEGCSRLPGGASIAWFRVSLQ